VLKAFCKTTARRSVKEIAWFRRIRANAQPDRPRRTRRFYRGAIADLWREWKRRAG
jgi:hypothetical protein